jgi:hypothetical protein
VNLDLIQRFDDLSARHHEAVMVANHLRTTFETWVPPGHFYSPYPDIAEVAARRAQIFDNSVRPVGIDLRDAAQVDFFTGLAGLAEDIPFPADPDPEFRFWFDNPAYGWADGIVLHAMLRHIRPKRVVELGSGYSSALLLDTVEGWLGGDVDVTFVDPHPELLHDVMRPDDAQRVTILPIATQDVPWNVFASLEAGDLLFLDTTHVVRPGSDVNHLFFNVLPYLAPGVWVHFHDVFWPFEYREDWVMEGRAWQEIYLLRAFLMFNPQYEIRWFQHYMWLHHRPLLEGRLPLMAKDPGGNLWLQRTAASR